MSGGFHADLEALHRAAGGFERVASDLAAHIGSFSGPTQGVSSDAFGLMPTARDALSAYAQTAQQALAGLHAVHSTLGAGMAAGLRGAARTYEEADQQSRARR